MYTLEFLQRLTRIALMITLILAYVLPNLRLLQKSKADKLGTCMRTVGSKLNGGMSKVQKAATHLINQYYLSKL